MNKFEQVTSDGHRGVPMPMSEGDGASGVPCWGAGLYSEVQCFMGNGHMGTPTDRNTPVKTLPSRNFVGSR